MAWLGLLIALPPFAARLMFLIGRQPIQAMPPADAMHGGAGDRDPMEPVCGGSFARRTADHIWLVSFMDYDLGYFDDETCRLEPIEDPFGPRLSPMSPE